MVFNFRKITRALLVTPAALIALQACAQDAAEQAAQPEAQPAAAASANPNIPAEYAFVVEKLPGVEISEVGPSPVAGLLQISVGTEVFYMSEDGQYFLQAEVMDLETRENLTDIARNSARGALLANFDYSQTVTFAAADEKHRVLIFTDIDCGYCRKLHRSMADYNANGITVQYAFFPRSGPNSESWTKAEQVWCSSDRKAALTAAKSSQSLGVETCADTPVAEHYALVNQLGLRGTPSLFTSNGTLIVGFREAGELTILLEEDAG